MNRKHDRQTPEARVFYLAVLLIASSIFLMGVYSRTVKKADDDQYAAFTEMFGEIYKNIKDRYVEPVDSKRLFEGALQGMFLTLDPHSQYMDPDNYTQLEKDTEGAFSGVGLHITVKDGVLTVIAPMPGSPAAKAGVQAWDRIIEINGKETRGINVLDAVKKLTGPSGTTVDITVYREGESDPLHFTLVRKSIKVDSVYYRMVDKEIGYARISKFSDNTARDLRKALEEFKEKGAKGLIVDLRFDTGGLLKEAVDVSNLFIGRGKTIVSTKGRLKNQTQEYKADKDPVTDLPLLVLINRTSASASEIVAGAVKDLGRGVIVGIKGQRSFGKGSVQTIEELEHSFEKDENGNVRPAAIRLTTAKYYTPNGTSIDKVGITPDIAVELPKGNEAAIYRQGLHGEPSTDEDDSATTKSRFSWKSQVTTSTESTTVSESSGKEDDESSEESDMPNSAVVEKKDDKTTAPEPKKIIPVDRSLFPDAEVEGETKKTEKKKPGEKTVDYQLEVGIRLLHDRLEKGKDFLAPDSGMPAQGAKESAAAAERKS
jgi:carboxyl-terminal processing protease